MNILIADDHRLFLEGMRYLILRLYPNASIIEAANGIDAWSQLSGELQFDLVLIDLKLPSIDGFTLLDKMAQSELLVPALVVSSSEDPEDINRALAIGASGFVSKSFTLDEMGEAIETILAGNIYAPLPFEGKTHRISWAEQHNITPRQFDVLRLAKNGKKNSEIASQLFISERTVKAHLQALFENLGAKNRTELVGKANQLGFD